MRKTLLIGANIISARPPLLAAQRLRGEACASHRGAQRGRLYTAVAVNFPAFQVPASEKERPVSVPRFSDRAVTFQQCTDLPRLSSR